LSNKDEADNFLKTVEAFCKSNPNVKLAKVENQFTTEGLPPTQTKKVSLTFFMELNGLEEYAQLHLIPRMYTDIQDFEAKLN